MGRGSEQKPEDTGPDSESEEDGPGEPFDATEYEPDDIDDFEEPDEGRYFEDGDLFVEDEEVGVDGEGEAAQPGKRHERPAGVRASGQTIEMRLAAFWATLLAQARGVELPGAPDTKLRRFGTVAAIVLVSLAVGAGTYLLGKGSGADVEQARVEGEIAGGQAGAIEGAAQGYSAGFRKGREAGFRKAYIPAYRLYYKRAYEQAGLDVPTDQQIDVPLP